jgi:hypothetical protein
LEPLEAVGMLGDLSGFVWAAPAEPGAFAWQECREYDARPEKYRGLVRQKGSRMRQYRPFAGTLSLYRALAKVEPTEAGILAFVQRYGPLGEGVETRAETEGERSVAVEPFPAWQLTVIWLRALVRLWDMIQGGDSDGLARVIKWRGKEKVLYQASPDLLTALGHSAALPEIVRELLGSFWEDRATIASADGIPRAVTHFTPGDVVHPARLFLIDSINGILGRTTQPAILWDDKNARVRMSTYPRSLLGAAYLQFATAILSGRLSRTCQVCGRAFEVTNVSSRNDRLTCSNTCRTRAYRDRQQRARDLRAKGWPLKRISKELGSDVSIIKRWLTQSEE